MFQASECIRHHKCLELVRMLLLHYFLDNSITGSCDEKDHCPGEQDCLRRHQHLILTLPFLYFLVKKTPPVTSEPNA